MLQLRFQCGNPNHLLFRSRCVDVADTLSNGVLTNVCPSKKQCTEGLDSDGDHVQHPCDNCTSTSNDQSDADDDGVGDACDNCNGKHPSDPTLGTDDDKGPDPNGGDKNNVTCTTTAECVTKTGEAESECEPEKMRGSTATGFFLDPNRYCSKLRDQDHDGLGDKCDNCTRMPNPEQRNCNKLLEIAEGVPYPYLGDACDANPCAWVPYFTGKRRHIPERRPIVRRSLDHVSGASPAHPEQRPGVHGRDATLLPVSAGRGALQHGLHRHASGGRGREVLRVRSRSDEGRSGDDRGMSVHVPARREPVRPDRATRHQLGLSEPHRLVGSTAPPGRPAS